MEAETVNGGALDDQYRTVFCDASRIVDVARSEAARSVNAAMTAAYWMIGQRIVEFEQSGAERAAYGAALLARLAADLTQRFGRGFSLQNIYQMRQFYRSFPLQQIFQTVSGESDYSPHERILQTVSGESEPASPETLIGTLRAVFPLPWSAYVKLLAVKNVRARRFYESEALRAGGRTDRSARQPFARSAEHDARARCPGGSHGSLLQQSAGPVPDPARSAQADVLHAGRGRAAQAPLLEAPQGPYAEQPAARASRHRRALRDRLRRWRRRARQAVGAGAAVDDTRRFLGRPATRFSERQLRLAIDVLTRKGWMANLPVSDSGDSAR